MPYIEKKDRSKFDDYISGIRQERINTPGELNYLVSMLVQKYIECNGLRYQQINDVVGALEGAKLEFYRRVASTYEDNKIASNGDIGPTGRSYLD